MSIEPSVKIQTVKFDRLVVEIPRQNNVADVNDVINTLNILTESDKETNFIDKPAATEYLKASGLISEPQPQMFKVENLQGCRELNDHLSNYMEKLIAKYSQPDVMINSANVSDNK